MACVSDGETESDRGKKRVEGELLHAFVFLYLTGPALTCHAGTYHGMVKNLSCT